MTEIIATQEEGSFAAKWEQFVEDNNLSPELADKLQYVYYAGAYSVFEELDAVKPALNTTGAVAVAVNHFAALQNEVEGFFEDNGEEDMTVLTVVAQEAT
jgi:hypothetical protein